MSRRSPRLRTILSGATVLVTLLALTVSLALVGFTTVMHRAASRAANSTESVMLGERVELDLLRLERADSSQREEIAGRLRSELLEAHRYVETEQERAVLVDAEVSTFRYLELESGDPAAARRLDSAIRALDRFVQVNREQARAGRARSAYLDQVAGVAAVSIAAVLLVLAIGILWWMNARAFRPILGLATAMERFGRGDRGARADEQGPEELSDMSRKFNRMADLLAAEREAQLAFLGGVAHDLRNPLSALRLSLRPLETGQPMPAEKRIRQIYDRASRQITRIDRMTGDLLDTAAIEAGKLDVKLEPHDLRALVREVAELFDDASPTHRLDLRLPEEPVEVRCDPARIVQVVTNLVSNGIKYSPGAPVIEIELSRDRSTAVLSVRDHGIGIAPADHEAVFEPFSRGGLSKETIPGVGLGLFVVRRIVQAHGGTVSVQSAFGSGSTFVVRLPCTEASAVSRLRARTPSR